MTRNATVRASRVIAIVAIAVTVVLILIDQAFGTAIAYGPLIKVAAVAMIVASVVTVIGGWRTQSVLGNLATAAVVVYGVLIVLIG